MTLPPVRMEFVRRNQISSTTTDEDPSKNDSNAAASDASQVQIDNSLPSPSLQYFEMIHSPQASTNSFGLCSHQKSVYSHFE